MQVTVRDCVPGPVLDLWEGLDRVHGFRGKGEGRRGSQGVRSADRRSVNEQNLYTTTLSVAVLGSVAEEEGGIASGRRVGGR